MSDLCQTYDNCSVQIGLLRDDGKPPLVPVSHTIARAHIEIELNEASEILGIKTLTLEEADTITPCTELSASRTSGIAPHMLYDNVKYVSGDYNQYIHDIDNTKYYQRYMNQILGWCNFEGCPDEVKTIQRYVQKGCLITDIIQNKLLQIKDGSLIAWNGDKRNKPSNINKLFVRFKVCTDGENTLFNKNQKLIDAYQQYYISTQTEKRICYITGQVVPCTDVHPSQLRHGGDQTKLISANDSRGFTYRGRFQNPQDVLSIGYETSQRAHHTLRWLIDTQGWKYGDQIILVFGMNGGLYPSLKVDTADLLGEELTTDSFIDQDNLSKLLSISLQQYSSKDENVVVMAVRAATQGRLSVTYYQKLRGYEYIKRIKTWHETCCWTMQKDIFDGLDKEGNPLYKTISFTGAPSIEDIVFATLGNRADDREKTRTAERIMSFIIDGRSLSRDLMKTSVRRASNSQSMETWEWNKTRSIACAVVKKYRFDAYGENWDLILDDNESDRNYVYGRLLAYAHNIETLAQYLSGAKIHTTFVQQLQKTFVNRPAFTWKIINQKIHTHIATIRRSQYSILVQEMHSLFELFENVESFSDNIPLNEVYLLGFDLQMKEFYRRSRKHEISETVINS